MLPLIVIAYGLSGCAGGPRDGDPARDAEPDVLATIDGAPIRMSDIQDLVGDQLARMDYKYRSDRYQLIDAALENALRDRLLAAEAAERGISVDELVSGVTAGVQVTDENVAEWYERNQDRLGGRTLDELDSQIETYLWQRGRDAAIDTLAQRIEEDKEVIYLIGLFDAGMDLADSPARGPADAPVILVEFSDFECPFCGRFFSTLQEIEESYGDRIRIFYRQYPLDVHPHAFKAAEASLCAHEQDRFWEMHDLMFEEQDRLDVVSLKEKAGRLGLDQEAFDRCLNSGRQAERVRRDMREGDRLGIEGTPALFLNGLPLPGGALPYEVVAAAIDRELRRARRR